MNNKKYSWEIISYDNQTGDNFTISLNPVQMQAINTFLGLQISEDEEGYHWTSFTDESLIKLINDFNKRYKPME